MSHWKIWAARTAEALAALAEGKVETATMHWLDARDAARRDGEMGNPCFASAQSNAAIGHVVFSQWTEAQLAFEHAADVWRLVAERLSHEEIDLPKSSSSHHLRLAIHHEANFAARVRHDLEALCSAGAAIARTNARLHIPSIAEDPDTAAADHAAISAAFGPESLSARTARGGDLQCIPSDWGRVAARVAKAASLPPPSFQRCLELAAEAAVLLPREIRALQTTNSKPIGIEE